MLGVRQYWLRYGGSIIRSMLVGTDNLATYYFDKKPFTGPLYIGWNITFRCNCRCDHCQSWKFLDKDRELDTGECLRIVQELGKAKISLLSINGGEPLLRADLYDIIKEAKRYRINVNIITNGALLEEQAEMLLDSGADAVTISIDGLSAEEHNSFRHYQGLFQKAEGGMRRLRRIKNDKPRMILGSTITRKNYRGLERLIEYWQGMVDEIVFQPVHDGFSESIFKISDKNLLFNSSDKEDFTACYSRLLKKYNWMRNRYEEEIPNFFFNRAYLQERYRCFAGFFMLQIDAYGNVYPCPEFIENIGNLRYKSFSDIWRSKEIQAFRRRIKDRKKNCLCWYRCTGPLNCYLAKLTPKE